MTLSKRAQRPEPEEKSLISRFRESDHPAVSLARDLLWVACVVGGVALILFLASGTWPAVVAVESGSMLPEMQIGDLVFVVAPDRFGSLITAEEGVASGHSSFGHPGDVIVFRPNGYDSIHPIIHRALVRIDAEVAENELAFQNPHGGIITKGDNNQVIDQVTTHPGIGRIEPVRDEWIIGKAVFSIPLVGYLPLHIVEFAILIIAIIIIQELIASRRRENN
ncbi:MAG: Signal peptidase, endoplasmic reticulum-type [Methanomicrobiales archaeon 53_19]|jgi:signal peptidase|nr:MAG: Signal peptidase, endoplasmic reticulum-type [Methanomicrobiales archaeon 53_19]